MSFCATHAKSQVQFPENQHTAGNVDAPEAPPQPQNPGVQGEQAPDEQVQVIQGQAPAQEGAQPPEGELEVIKNVSLLPVAICTWAFPQFRTLHSESFLKL